MLKLATLSTAEIPLAASREDRLYRRLFWRLIPLLFVGYLVAYLNRVNVGFAKLQMMSDLRLSDAMYGFGAGVFFVGYAAFEVPSNLLLHRIGARRWLARIMVTWGVISGLTLFARTPGEFYALRFALGLAEAGFFPGIIYYLTQWFPSGRRAHMIAVFMTAVAASGVIGGPLSGWIMQRWAGVRGLAGWQWLFLLEAVPSVIMGVVFFVALPDAPASARWLEPAERDAVERALAEEERGKRPVPLRAVFSHPVVWALCLVYFAINAGVYTVGFWMPQILKDSGLASVLDVGWMSAVPYAAGAVAMVLVGRYSDASGKRRAPCLLCLLAAAIGFVLIALSGGRTSLAVAGLVMAECGLLASTPLFWTFPAAMLGGVAAAAGIAFINALGTFAGFVAPYAIGLLNDATGRPAAGNFAVAGMVLLGAIVVRALLPP